MEIGLLIDCNCFNVIELIVIICVINDEFCVGFVLLGWSIVGLVVMLDIFLEDYILEFLCYFILVREVVFSVDDSKLSFIFNGKIKEVINLFVIN